MASIFRRLRLGFGNRPDSYGPEKSWLAGIDFRKGSDTGTIDFNGTDWDVSVNGVQTGTIPGSGGGGGITSVVPGDGIEVDATDPDNPEVSAKISTDASNALSIGTDGGLYATAGGGGGGGSGDIVGFYAAPVSGTVHYLGDSPFIFAPLTASSPTSNRLFYVPFTVPINVTISTIGLNMQSSQPGSKGRVGIYINAITSGKFAPSSLLYSSGDFALTSAGLKTEVVSWALTAGTVYWLAIVESVGASTMATSAATPSINLGRIGTANHNAYNHLYQTLASGWTSLPATASGLTPNLATYPVAYCEFA